MYKVQNDIPRNVNSDYHLTMLMGSEFIFLTLLILFYFLSMYFCIRQKNFFLFWGTPHKAKIVM